MGGSLWSLTAMGKANDI